MCLNPAEWRDLKPPEWRGPLVCKLWAEKGPDSGCEGRLHIQGGSAATSGTLLCRKHCGCGQDDVTTHRAPRVPVKWNGKVLLDPG